MKAIVLQTDGGFAAVLRDDGVVEKIRRSCNVGETIELEEQKVVRFPKRLTQWAAGAAAALILLAGGGMYGYNNAYAYSYVTLDTNPSIEYTLNRKNEVLRITALNEDAESIVESLNAAGVKKESLTDAIGRTTELLYEGAYLGEDCDNCILVSVTSHGDRQAQDLLEEVGVYYSDYENELTVYVTEATTSEAKQAQMLGVSTGRYKLAEDMLGGEEGMTREEAERFEQTTVRELIGGSGADMIHAVGEAIPRAGEAIPDGEAEEASEEPAGGQTPRQEENIPAPDEQQGMNPGGQDIYPGQPGADPAQPGDDPGQPGADPTQPGDDPGQPGGNPTQPGGNPTQPGGEPGQQGTDPAQQGGNSEPGQRPGSDNGAQGGPSR